jgi:pentatricopeptide repeat protein
MSGASGGKGSALLEGYRTSKPTGSDGETRLMQSPTSTNQESLSRRQDFNLRTELKYLADPLLLADRVRALLKAGDSTKALSLVRMASKGMQCSVSWNCILDHHLSQGKVNAALKTYNEVSRSWRGPVSRCQYSHAGVSR